MKKKYQKPACEIYEVQAEGVIAASGGISQKDTPILPGIENAAKGFFSKK